MNQDRFRNPEILVCGINFGCGSSREGAVYTLQESGINVLIAPSFGDIFAANCLKNGLLTIVLPQATVADLRAELVEADEPKLTVDLENEVITRPGGETLAFSPDPFQKDCLIKGLNEIDISLQFAGEMDAFETTHRTQFPWLAPQGH